MVPPGGHRAMVDESTDDGGTGAVDSVSAGPGISVTGTPSNPIVNNTGATSVTGTDNRVQAIPTTGAVVLSQFAVADWAIGTTRWFALDGVNGNDAFAGFSNTSAADAGTKAKKTLAALLEVIPPNGAGRAAQVYIANGGVNTAATYTDPPNFSDIHGYAIFGVAATGTNTNAGATAFDGTTNTDVYAGGITVPGLNTAGYNPTGTPTTTVIQMVKAGGGAPGLPAEPAAPLGWRIRFDINTTTVALRGACKTIVKVSGTDTVTVNTALAAVPVGSDVFYIEKAGVLLSNALATIGGVDTQNLSFLGLDFTGAGSMFVYGGRPTFCFCGANGINAEFPAIITCARGGVVAVAGGGGGTRNAGGGLRNAGTVGNLSFGSFRASWTGYVGVGLVEIIDIPGASPIQDGSVFAGGLVFDGGNLSTQQNDAADNVGASGTTALMRLIGPGTNVGVTAGIQCRGTRLSFRNIDFTNMGAHPAISLVGVNDVVVVGTLSGSTGNTDVGLDLTAARGSRIMLVTQPTVTGTAGDVRLSDGTIVSWAQLFTTGIVDRAGNRIIPATGPVSVVKSFSGVVITSSGGPTFTYATDIGNLAVAITGNETNPHLYPTSARLITRLRLVGPAGSGSQPPTATLYKNGVATTMTCTLAAGQPVGVSAVDAAHPILFADGDQFDVRIDVATTSEGNVPFSATLEGPT